MSGFLQLTGEAAVIVALVAANGFFVAAEFALVKVRASQLHLLQASGGWRVRLALRANARLDVVLSATQFGITLASLGLGWVGKPFVAARLEPWLLRAGVVDPTAIDSVSFAVAFAVITFLHIVFGELAPKSLAIQRPQRTSLLVSGPLLAFYYALFPFIWVLNRTANLFLRWAGLGPAGAEDDHATFSNAEFEYLLGRARHAHPAEALVNRLMLRSLRLHDVTARQIMRPREQIVALWLTGSREENLARARASEHSRFLVCATSLDDVKGVLLIREWLWRLQEDAAEPSFAALVRPALTFSETTPIHEMIARFRATRNHLAVVRDGAGRVAGLATLEDAIEEIIGSIRDESDTESGPIHEHAEHMIVVNLALPMRELQAETGWTFDGRPRETVADWIARHHGQPTVPPAGLTIDDFLIQALPVPPGAPARVRVERRHPAPPA